jgi:hypothetical protein
MGNITTFDVSYLAATSLPRNGITEVEVCANMTKSFLSLDKM